MSKLNYAKDYCPAEIMASFISRNLVGFHGTGFGHAAQLPWIAIRLAQATHSPDLWMNSGPAMGFNPKYDKLMMNLDHRVSLNNESPVSMSHNIELFNNPKTFNEADFFGGFQIDKYGNCNMAYIGDQKKPKFRGPGTIGLINMAFSRTIFIFTYHHTARLFVEKVGFISGPGWGDGPGWRERHGCLGGGPRYCITPIAIFDFEEETKVMRLKSVHPGHTVEEVLSRMSFKPIVPAKVPETEPPTVEEVEFLRSLDPDGLLPQLTR